MKTKLQLVKDRDDAISALSAAKSEPDRKKAVLALEAASTALARFDAKSKETHETHEVHEVHKTEEEDDEPKKPLEEEEEEGSGSKEEEEEEEEEDDGDDDADDDGDDDKDGDDDGDDDEKAAAAEEEEEEEEERCKADALASAEKLLASAKAAKSPAPVIESARAMVKTIKAFRKTKASATRAALKATVRTLTGKRSTKAAAKALQALSGKAAALQAARRHDKIAAMLDKAVGAGKIPPAAKASLAGQDPAWLRAHLKALPKAVHTTADPARVGRTLEGGHTDGTPSKPTTDSRVGKAITLGFLDEGAQKFVREEAMRAGKSVDDVIKSMNETIERRGLNGSAAR